MTIQITYNGGGAGDHTMLKFGVVNSNWFHSNEKYSRLSHLFLNKCTCSHQSGLMRISIDVHDDAPIFHTKPTQSHGNWVSEQASNGSSTKEKDLIAPTTDQIIHFYSSQFSNVPKS